MLPLKHQSIIAISNYKMSKETETLASKYDYIIRFNIGANQNILSQHNFYNQRTDLCCLSGWRTEKFGEFDGFSNKNILFSRPKCQPGIKYFFKDICVTEKFEQKILEYTKNLFYIPIDIFHKFVEDYGYDHPTTGLMILYYFKVSLGFNIDCINFFVDNNLSNFFAKTGKAYHKINKERKILESLNITNILC